MEINLFGEGLWNGEEVLILGEVKSPIYSREVETFSNRAEMIEKKLGKKDSRFYNKNLKE